MRTSYTLITGASSAIGRAIAAELAGSRRLILHGRNVEKLLEIRQTIDHPGTHQIWTYDLTEITGLSATLALFLAERQIGVDAFVHSAGTLRLGAFRLMSPEVEKDIFNVNVIAAIEIVNALRFRQQAPATLSDVVMISSGASLFGEKGNVTYASSKGAADAFIKSLSMDFAPAGRANSILPGMVAGGMSDLTRQAEDYDNVIRANYPLGIGRPEDIAGMTDFLLSGRARWITGQQILVDGGYSAHCNHVV